MLKKIARKFGAKTGELRRDSKPVTANHWSKNLAGSDAFSSAVYWLAVPAVQKRHQRRACLGTPYTAWVEYCVGEFLHNRTPVNRMLSIGCGSGDLERDLYRLNAFHNCDAIDIAPTAIQRAMSEAESLGASTISYKVGDVEESELPRDHYDAAWFNGSLHHIRQLETVCDRVRGSLKVDGWLFFNEYVGRNHFGFDSNQREAITHAFGLIPARFRRSFANDSVGMIRENAALPDPRDVARADPSEAVRSEDILGVVDDYFDVKTINPCGGSLLQFLLHGIAGNFRHEDADSMQILQMLFDIEDALIESNTLTSDFVVVAASPRKP